MNGRYVLDGKTPIEEADPMKRARWFEVFGNRRVALTAVGEAVKVSTVFSDMDYGWGDGPPILFETMVFGGEYDSYNRRYSTWEEAEEGHKQVVEMVKRGSDAI